MSDKIRIFLKNYLGTEEWSCQPIQKGGSDRHFYRVRLPKGKTLILMAYGTEVEENARWVDIALFLKSIGAPVPQIIASDMRERFLLLEDLGETDLYAQRALPWRQRRRYYLTTLFEIFKLHRLRPGEWPADLQLCQGYDRSLYEWEQNYFKENFLEAICGLSLSEDLRHAWKKEREELIDRLLCAPACLIHRDFQSQNILLQGNRPVFIDFQGLRTGNVFYDLGSLICDPYVTFSPEERNELISCYYRIMQPDYGLEQFRAFFWEGSAQRLMQALGAYGFLGLKKNKPAFLTHIPGGVINLAVAAANARNLPILSKLAQSCLQRLSANPPFFPSLRRTILPIR